jgi:hypothetical protein
MPQIERRHCLRTFPYVCMALQQIAYVRGRFPTCSIRCTVAIFDVHTTRRSGCKLLGIANVNLAQMFVLHNPSGLVDSRISVFRSWSNLWDAHDPCSSRLRRPRLNPVFAAYIKLPASRLGPLLYACCCYWSLLVRTFYSQVFFLSLTG